MLAMEVNKNWNVEIAVRKCRRSKRRARNFCTRNSVNASVVHRSILSDGIQTNILNYNDVKKDVIFFTLKLIFLTSWFSIKEALFLKLQKELDNSVSSEKKKSSE